MIAATVVEVQVGVDDDVNAGEVEVLFVEWKEAGVHIGDRRVQQCGEAKCGAKK